MWQYEAPLRDMEQVCAQALKLYAELSAGDAPAITVESGNGRSIAHATARAVGGNGVHGHADR